MRKLGNVEIRNMVFTSLFALGMMSCGQPARQIAVVQPVALAPVPRQVGSLANASSDYDQIGDHYQKAAPAFWVRPGYKVTLVASKIGNARFLAFDDRGVLYMSRPIADAQGLSDVVTLELKGDTYVVKNKFVEKLKQAQGLCFHDGWMYISESQSIIRARDTNGDGKADDTAIVLQDLAGGSGHWWRSLLVTDDAIYTSVGDPSNISDQADTDREKIFKYALDGKGRELWSSGIRNTEKLLLRPGTDEVWGGDQGSDNFGKDYGKGEATGSSQPITDFYPPDEFNHYVKDGFYGHPFITGNRIPRTEYWNNPNLLQLADKTIPPAWCFGPHWAVDGFTFYTGNQFPADSKGDAFCGLHGSWNRVVKSGYRIERICFDKVTGVPYGSQLIVGCLSPDKQVLARPVDVVQAPDGSLLFTSDSNSSIYRLSYVGGA
jgi:glucose/arabinose dehydrogenase